MRNLPSLNGLRAFEAAARCRSFTSAATELNVTQAAVSRSIKSLEAQLGYRLFERHANSLELTGDGELLVPDITSGLDLIAAATRRVHDARSKPILTIGSGPTFAMRWLIPRLVKFQELHPDIEVHTVNAGPTAPLSADWTCGIRLGQDHSPGVESVPLFSPVFFPVCSPRIAARLKRPTDLYKATILDVKHMPEDWTHWFGAAELEVSNISKRSVFDYYAFALQAAVDGSGVAIGFEPYVVDDLEAGRLVKPFDTVVTKPFGWYFTFRGSALRNPAFQKFNRWLLKESKEASSRLRRK